jgi:hypothetical protein
MFAVTAKKREGNEKKEEESMFLAAAEVLGPGEEDEMNQIAKTRALCHNVVTEQRQDNYARIWLEGTCRTYRSNR